MIARLGLGVALLLVSGGAFGGDETLKATVVEKPAQEVKPADASSAAGTVVTCSQGQQKRTVGVTSQDPAKGVPCEVHYKKETEQPGHDQVLYTATNEVSFCEAKAKAFVEKLTGLGWSCN